MDITEQIHIAEYVMVRQMVSMGRVPLSVAHMCPQTGPLALAVNSLHVGAIDVLRGWYGDDQTEQMLRLTARTN